MEREWDIFPREWEHGEFHTTALHGVDELGFDRSCLQSFGDLSAEISKEAHAQGYISSSSADKVINAEEADALTAHGAVLWGTNAILRSTRARQHLGWNPAGPSLSQEVPAIVSSEAKRLGL